MKKSKEETIKTRQRIIDVAATEFRRNGIIASGIAELMALAGLTNGGFYRHFKSKDELIAEASKACLNERACELRLMSKGKTNSNRLTALAAIYLSKDHRDNPQKGCLLSALGSELVRTNSETRKIATQGFLEMVNMFAEQFSDLKSTEARKKAILAVSTMVGALTLARIVVDKDLSDSILDVAANSIKKM